MQYDAAGNLTNDGNQSYSYDATGQQTYASGLGAGGSAPTFTNDPLNPPGQPKTDIKLVHLTELRSAVNGLRVRAGLAAFANWDPDPNPTQPNVTLVHHNHIRQLRTKLEEALNALHLPIGTYEHPGPNANDPIYAIDFQELRNKIKDAWTALASSSSLTQAYDGDGLRVKKTEYGWSTFYLRSGVLGGQVISEIGVSASGGTAEWQRGYVYAGGSLMAVQQSGVFWMHEDPVTKSKRVTDSGGNIVSTIDLDPWGGETNRSSNPAFQPQRYTSYTRDSNGGDDAMFRRYQSNWTRFAQPDPYDGSYNLTDPQSFNRYAYVQNDPVNFVDPLGLDPRFDDRLGPPPPPPILVLPYGGTLVTNTSAPHYRGGGYILGGDVHFLTEAGNEGGETGGGTGGGGGQQNPGQRPAPNANCIQNAVAGSIGTSRGLIPAIGPNGPTGRASHDGDHVLSGPGGPAAVTTLGPLAGTVIRTGNQGDGLRYVDVRLNSSIAGGAYNVRYKDLLTVGVGVGTRLSTGSNIGTVRPAGDPRSEIGLHITLVQRSAYPGYVNRVRNGQYSPIGTFMSAGNDRRSPVRCP